MQTIRIQRKIYHTEPARAQPETEEEILLAIQRIVRVVDRYTRGLSAEIGLSGPQLRCLRQVARLGPLPTGALAKAVGLSAATVCGILDRLEARDLVRRERQAEDKRRVLVSLSAHGRFIVDEAAASLNDPLMDRVRALSPAEQKELRASLERLDALLQPISAAASDAIEQGKE